MTDGMIYYVKVLFLTIIEFEMTIGKKSGVP